MMLVLKRSPEQETALHTLLDQQHDKSSPLYHAWLTPQQFGGKFGLADGDVESIISWLQSHGFEVAKVSSGRTVIEFSGTAGQVQDTFHTAIHKYVVAGEEHWANASDPQIPAALSVAVAGIDTLHNFPRHSMNRLGGLYTRSKETGRVKAVPGTGGPSTLFTLNVPNGCGVQPSHCYALGPYDFGTIYDVLPLWNATPTHIDGTGQTIAVVSESNINGNDVNSFRSYFGLPTPANLNVVVSGPDPGLTGAETEADLDAEWSGAIAPNATIDLVVSETTEASLGADLSAVYIVDNNLAPVMNVSYGICELDLGTTGNQFFNQLWQQAAAQGITVLVASGDSGSAVCDRDDGPAPAPAMYGLTVSGFSSTPYNVAVGGTDFNDLTNASTYWNATNTTPPGDPSGVPTVSAKSYIPETTWNDSCTNGVFGSLLGFSTNAETNCNNPELVDFVIAVGGSGGKSNCTSSNGQDVSSCSGGYPKPAWQTGSGVPSDGGRDVPDVSLFSSVSSPSGSFYIVCEADAVQPGNTSCDASDPNTEFLGIGGTSASAPTFAAIMALVNQKTNSQQGNANYILYKLAAEAPSAFHDVPAGGTIAMPCAKRSPDCTVTNDADSYGVLSGYSTTTGYDLATGLGSVDANNLVTKWDTVTTSGSATTLSLTPSPVNITHGQPVNVAVSVAPAGGATGKPTGNVSLIAATGSSRQQGVAGFALTDGAASGTTSALPGGTFTVTANYPGDGTYAPSISTPLSVTVAPESSKTFVNLVTFDINGNLTSYSASGATYGSGYNLLRFDVGDPAATFSPTTGISSNCSKGESNCPTGSITLNTDIALIGTPIAILNSEGYTEIQSLGAGSYSVSASYSGDPSYAASTGMGSFNIALAPTTLSASVTGALQYGVSNTVTGLVQTTSDGQGLLGTMSFSLDGSPLTLYNLYYDDIPYQAGTPPTYAGYSGSGSAEFLTVGAHTLTAQYSGDANYAPSTSAPIMFSVSKYQPVFGSFGVTPSTADINESVTLSAYLNGSSSPPTGTMTFYDNGTAISGMAAYTSQPYTLIATMAYSPTTAGNHAITVSYSGDSDYLPASSGPATLTVIGPSYSISANPTLVTVPNPGGSGGTTLTFTSISGFSGTYSLAPQCTNLPQQSTCSVSPASITLSSTTTTATVTLTISTTGSSTVAPMARTWPAAFRTTIAFSLLTLIMICFLLHKPRRVEIAVGLLAIAALLTIASCGGGGGNGSSGNSGTPVGLTNAAASFTLGSTTQSVSFSVDVR